MKALCQYVKEEWDSLDQQVIGTAIRECSKRLQTCIEDITKLQCEHYAHFVERS